MARSYGAGCSVVASRVDSGTRVRCTQGGVLGPIYSITQSGTSKGGARLEVSQGPANGVAIGPRLITLSLVHFGQK